MDKNLGKHLAAIRTIRNYSQNYVAKALNINTSLLSKYENGYLEPNLTILKNMASFYRISIDQLIGYKTYKKSDGIKDNPPLQQIKNILNS